MPPRSSDLRASRVDISFISHSSFNMLAFIDKILNLTDILEINGFLSHIFHGCTALPAKRLLQV